MNLIELLSQPPVLKGVRNTLPLNSIKASNAFLCGTLCSLRKWVVNRAIVVELVVLVLSVCVCVGLCGSVANIKSLIG